MNILAIVAVVVWVVSLLVDMVSSYNPPAGIYIIMMIVIGGSWGASFSNTEPVVSRLKHIQEMELEIYGEVLTLE